MKSSGSFLTYWLPNTNILFKIVRICNSQFKCNYLKNEKPFLNLLLHFRNLHQILNNLKEKMIVIANLFPKLQTVKNLVRTLPKKSRFRTRFESQHVKASQILTKSPWEPFYPVFFIILRAVELENVPLELDEILGVFVNTLSADDKYPVQDCQNLPLPIPMQFSEKRKTFSECFAKLLECTSNFKHFQRKYDRHS